MRKPIIGITSMVLWKEERQVQNETYIQAVRQAGGVPVLLPAVDCDDVIDAHIGLLDGLLVSGGPDVDPRAFGEEPVPELGGVNPQMDAYELKLLNKMLKMDKPILGICRGEQVLNIAAGGTVHQDIYRSVKGCLKHRQEAPRWFQAHSVRLTEGSKLEQLFGGREISVNTFHHQAVAKVAPGFTATAYAPDGIIEAIESNTHRFVVGVQWHPEGMWNAQQNYSALFDAFIKASAENA